MPGEGFPSDVPPAAFGRFRVLHQIGTGSLGPVFRGEDPETREPVAIKLLRLKIGPERTRLIAEELAALVGKVPDHPNLSRVLQAGLQDHELFIVADLAVGESLDIALSAYGPAAIADVLPRLRGLADALDLAASQGLWHGALTPGAIIVSAGATQLTGIGVAQILERARVRLAPARLYTAPEVIEALKSSPAADQYALAAIAHEWLLGKAVAGPAESPLVLPELPGVDGDALSAALTSALAPSPHDRFASCTAFVDRLQQSAPVGSVTRSAATASSKDVAAQVPAKPEDVSPAAEAPLLALLPEERLIEVAPPDRSIADLVLDPEPRLPQPAVDSTPPDLVLPPAPARPAPVASIARERVPAVQWRGTLSAHEEVAQEKRRGLPFGMMVAVLVGGVALGILGGYLWGGRSDATNAPAAGTPRTSGNVSTAEPAASARQPQGKGQPFTEAPVPAPPSTATPETAPPAAAKPPAAPAVSAAARPREGVRDAMPAVRANSARLLVRSTPAGATVAIDGTARGSTPLTLRDLSLGTRSLVISRPGYEAAERRITLTADRPSRSIEVTLVPVGKPSRPAAAGRASPADAVMGSLLVESRPAGAIVRIDGRAAGSTPLELSSIDRGTHTVMIELPGYRPWTTSVDIKAGTRTRVAASLEQGRE